ncbi:hypothetical protein CYMTET_46741 [Cymbomonas tetramitiformis]|uniref:Uncharacterized protein n=1 Tax=Cymbomonas tetramitiformis TaxID=36881 RepID=A0AAE0BWS4_9CHLO|nr:hypothetical protein CYMTET_46741 [Cymbomonas tetramitiformis]
MINHLSCNYDEVQDKFVRVRVGSGVKMPSFRKNASKQKTIDLMQQHFEEMDPETLEEDEKTITISLHKVLTEHLCVFPLPEDRTDLKIKVDGDGAPVMPRVNHTCVAIKVIRYFEDMGISEEEWEGLNSPFTSHTLLLFDGKEDYEDIKKHTKRLRQELADIRRDGLQVDGRQYTVSVIAGGDLKWLNAVCALSTCSHTFPCPWCLVCQGELHLTGADLKYTRRTLALMSEHAHLPHDGMEYPWECECCECTYDSPQALIDEEAPTTNAARLKFQLEHFGVGWHKENLWGLIPEDMVADLLHHDLREIHFILERTCKRFLITTALAEAYCEFLRQYVGCFIKVKKEGKKAGAKKTKQPNIIGRECEATLKVCEPLMVLIHGVDTENYHLAMKVWTAFKALRTEMFARLGKGHTMHTRAQKAYRIRRKAGEYISAKLTLGSVSEDGTQYSHIAYWHFPEMVMKHGDLVDLSTQALEHLHWLRKKDYRDLSNKGKKSMKQLLRTEVSRFKLGGIVKTRNKSAHKQRKMGQRARQGEQ